jgi:hypothetical protein
MRYVKLVVLFSVSMVCVVFPPYVLAHCDAMDGPVVKAGQRALDSGNINLALIWIQPSAEEELRHAWAAAASVRKLGDAAKSLAERYFLETLVRLHRSGEGAPYTGLKPAGTHSGPAITAADRAVEAGDAQPVMQLLDRHLESGIHARFKSVKGRAGFERDDVNAGREFVKAYVEFVHYVEGVHAALTGNPDQHESSSPTKGATHEHGH